MNLRYGQWQLFAWDWLSLGEWFRFHWDKPWGSIGQAPMLYSWRIGPFELRRFTP